jgi:hypothetical protein
VKEEAPWRNVHARARARRPNRHDRSRLRGGAGELRIVADPPVIIPIEDIIPAGSEWENPTPIIKKLLSSYRRTLAADQGPRRRNPRLLRTPVP